MNGQGNNNNSFPGSSLANHGPNVNNPGFIQNNAIPTGVPIHDSHTDGGWRADSSSGVNNQKQISFMDLLGEDGWPSSTDTPVGTGQRFQGMGLEPYIAPFQDSTNMIPHDNQTTNKSSILHGFSSGAFTQNIDLNASFEGNDNDPTKGMEADLSLSLSSPDALKANDNPLANNSSVLPVSSRARRYVLEENDGGDDLSSGDRRVSSKRRAPEDAPRLLLSLGESSSSREEARNSEREATPTHRNANGSLNLSTPFIIPSSVGQPEQLENRLGVGKREAISSMHQTSSGLEEAESSHRTSRLRRAANPQDSVLPSIFSSGTSQYSQLESGTQSNTFFPFNHFPNTISTARLPVNGTHREQSFMHSPNSLLDLQPSPWFELTSSRIDVSAIPFAQEQSSRNVPRSILLSPESERGNVAQSPTGINIFNENSSSLGNIASSSRSDTLAGIHFTSVPNGVPRYNTNEQYTHGSYYSLYSQTSAAAREMGLSMRSGNARPFQVPMNSELMTRAGRQTGNCPENPSALQSMDAASETSRLVSEVRNSATFFRRDRPFQFQDFMVIDSSIGVGVPEEDDMNEGMRLDVDNMSYEELLALEENIGNVCTGLSEEAILTNMRRRTYESTTLPPPMENDLCCICREDYADGDDLGKLDCEHDFHFTCIKQWLVQKNSCPTCKRMALARRDRDN